MLVSSFIIFSNNKTNNKTNIHQTKVIGSLSSLKILFILVAMATVLFQLDLRVLRWLNTSFLCRTGKGMD